MTNLVWMPNDRKSDQRFWICKQRSICETSELLSDNGDGGHAGEAADSNDSLQLYSWQ
jgi:hypothetical protein